MVHSFRYAVLVLAGYIALGGAASQAAVFNPVTATLANGLQVVVVPNHLSPVVHQMVWYKVGSSDEVAGKTGLAHYLEHLMFRGSKNMPAGSYSSTVASWGGTENAFTSYDYTAYFITATADRLAEMMSLEAERMQNLSIRPELATPELQVVLNERQERTDNNPEGRFTEKLRSTLMPDHAYGRPVIGWKPDIEGLTAADATDFYLHHYAPNNAVVVISGDVDARDVLAKAAAIYGRIPRRDVPPRLPVPDAPQPQQRQFSMIDKGIEQPQIVWEVAVPSRGAGRRQESYALEVLAEALDGQSGPLYRQLVARQGIASGVEVSYDPDARGAGLFYVGLTPKSDGEMQQVQPALIALLRDLSRHGLDEKDVRAARHRLIRAAAFARDSLMMPGYVFGMAMATGQKVDDVEQWPQRMAAVSVADVNATLRHLLDNPKSVTGLLLPDPTATEAERNAAQSNALREKEIR